MPTTLARETDFLLDLARRAGEIALAHHGGGIAYESKDDASPVTAIDRECELVIARAIEEQFPDDGILGEEGSEKPSRSGRVWIVDPIDGTRDFVRGHPSWGNLIALESAGEVVLGAANLPAMGDLFHAVRGGGAFRNGAPIRVSAVASPSNAVLCVNGLNTLGRYAFAPRLMEWMENFWAVRSMGGCLDAVMVARGWADLWIDSGGKPWDFAALGIIAEEAGARFFDFAGARSIYGGNCVICTPGLAAEALRFVST